MNKQVMYENLLKLLRKGKWELQGDEILAFHQVFSFLVKELEETKKPKQEPIMPIPAAPSIKEEVAPKQRKKKNVGSI